MHESTVVSEDEVGDLLIACNDLLNVPRSNPNRGRSSENGGAGDGHKGYEDGCETHAVLVTDEWGLDGCAGEG